MVKIIDTIPVGGGVYRITNTLTGDYYVGSTVDFRGRWRSHLSDLRRGVHNNPILLHAWNKYGEDAFVLDILDFVVDDTELLAKEQSYLDSSFPPYNISRVAGRPMAGLLHTPEALAKMSASMKSYWDEHPEQKEILSKLRKGVKLSPETCERISKATRGSHTMSEEQKRRLVEISKSRERTEDERQKRREGMTGFRHSPESIEKCRAAKEEYWRKVKTGEIVRGSIPRDAEGKFAMSKDKE